MFDNNKKIYIFFNKNENNNNDNNNDSNNDKKNHKNNDNPQPQIFQPIICELSGTMNKEGLPKLIEFLAAKFSSVAHFSGEDDTPKFTTYWYSRFSTWLQICNVYAVTRAATDARKREHVPDFPLTIRDVQNVLATDEDCEDSYFEDDDEEAARKESA
jgi:hypothetical protein